METSKLYHTHKIHKGELVEFVKAKLSNDDIWAKRALLLLYSKQTENEKNAGLTNELNGIGFSGTDSLYLSSLAIQLGERIEAIKKYSGNVSMIELYKKATLSPKQMEVLKKCIKKYWAQVIQFSDETKLLNSMKLENAIRSTILV
jgi:hypothetical protein